MARRKQRKSCANRTKKVQTADLTVITVYQRLSTHPADDMEATRFDLENEVARTPPPQESILVIGGDHNAHIGRGVQRQETCGTFGLSTPTKEAGQQLLDWCESLEMQWVNAFSNHQNRGTWFNRSIKRWCEIDGFIMRKKQRHKLITKLSTTEEMSFSDHEAITIWLRVQTRSRGRLDVSVLLPSCGNSFGTRKFA